MDVTKGTRGVHKKTHKDFYAAAGGASLAQYTPPGAGRDGKNLADLAPDSPDGEYKGNQEKSKGIIGMLEVVESRCACATPISQNRII